MVMNRFYFIILLALLILLGYLSYRVLEPFMVAIAWAVVFSVLFYPLYAFFLRYIRLSSVASILVLLVIGVVVIGPFTYFSILLVKELGLIIERVGGGKFAIQNILDHPSLQAGMERLASLLDLDPAELNRAIGDQISRWGTEIISRTTAGIRNVLGAVTNFLLMSLTIFFFLQAGPKFFERVLQYLPFAEQEKKKLVQQVQDIIISTIYGGVIIALIQGTVGGLAFFILGLSSPTFWGFAMALASFLPLVGPFIIWLPASFILFFQGDPGRAVALAIIGVAGISAIDNFLRPLIIGKRTKMPFLFIFFSVLGGIQLFGLIGFIMGPMVLAVFISVLDLFWRVDQGDSA